MKILMLTPYLPYPLWSGGQIRTFNLLKQLSVKHEITLFSFIREKKEEEYVKKLKDITEEVKIFVKRPPFSLTSLTLAAATYYPLVVCLYLNSQVKKAIAEASKRKKFDLIHAETFYVMPNIPKSRIPIILAEQTIEYLVYQHHTENVSNIAQKILMNLDVAKIYFWEKYFWHKSKRVIAMSEADRQLMRQRIPNLTVDLVPNGVDTEFFSFRKQSTKNKNKRILFVGNFKWLQNREAVTLLIKNIFPLIKKQIPGAKLWIVGKFPTREIRNYANPSIIVDENISDIRDAYQKSDLLLAPIYGPGGTRYKILESMATGLPVVTTPTGIEGLAAENLKDTVIAESWENIARSSVKVLSDTLLYQRLAENGRRLVEDRYSWNSIAKKLDIIYQKAIKN